MKKYFIFISIVTILLIGCSAGELITKNYYILEYYAHNEKDLLRQETPINASALILDADIPRSYSRKQIVIRHIGQRITYSNNELWGIDVSKIMSDLLSLRLNSYNVFKRTQREYWDKRPEYEILTQLHNIELNKSSRISTARLNITFILKKSGSEKQLAVYNKDTERSIHSNDIDDYVQTINEIFLEEADNFIQKILVQQGKIAAQKITEEDQSESLEEMQFEIYNDESISEGNGLLLLPDLTQTGYDSYYRIVDRHGYEQYARVGEAFPLMSGEYTIYYGSGDETQQMKKENVKIIPRYKQIVEPDWGCLIVDIIDENRNFVKVRYEIFDLETGESYGSEFPAEEEVGEQQKVWMLKPGLYKITVNSEPFSTYQNFTTVKVEKNKARMLTVVMSLDDDGNPEQMVGAGILGENFLEASQEKLRLNSAIHGNLNFNSDNETDKNVQEYTLNLNGQLENLLIYNLDPFHYSMRNLVKVGVSKETDRNFLLSADEFDLKNTLIYYFLENLGLYIRADVNTHFFSEKYIAEENFWAIKKNTLNNVKDSTLTNEFRTKPNFLPLIMKEGMGINFRLLNRSKASLSLRSGLGFRQEFRTDTFNKEESSFTDSINVEHLTFKEQENLITTGTEFSLIGDFELPLGLSYSINADLLLPFAEDEDYSIEWENVFNLKLFKYISLDYKLNLENQADKDYFITNHSLYLRITYFIR